MHVVHKLELKHRVIIQFLIINEIVILNNYEVNVCIVTKGKTETSYKVFEVCCSTLNRAVAFVCYN